MSRVWRSILYGLAKTKWFMPDSKPYFIVTLDVQDTLYHFKKPIAEQYIDVARQCGVKTKLDAVELSKAFKKSFKAASEAYPNYGLRTMPYLEQWWALVVHNTFSAVMPAKDIPEDLWQKLYDRFSSSEAYTLYPDVQPFLARMKRLMNHSNNGGEPAIVLGTISNSDRRVESVLQSFGIRPEIDNMADLVDQPTDLGKYSDRQQDVQDAYEKGRGFDFAVTSYDARYEKPDSAIFDYAADLCATTRLGMIQGSVLLALRSGDTSPLETPRPTHFAAKISALRSTYVHIGDDYEKDYLGALSARSPRWHSLLLVRDADAPRADVDTVSDLNEAAAAVELLFKMNMGKDDVQDSDSKA